jgi:hypothetical protein
MPDVNPVTAIGEGKTVSILATPAPFVNDRPRLAEGKRADGPIKSNAARDMYAKRTIKNRRQ